MTLPLLAVVGATGTGKSALSLVLAERLVADGHPAEIVNADAMQLYRGMDIGTAKLAPAERRGIPHHLLDILEVTEEASVADYQSRALEVIGDIRGRGATPILVGGSGLYVSSVLYDFRFPGTDPAIRARLEAELAAHGPGMVFQRLRELDPDAAAAIGPYNGRRIVRALEVIELTGEPFGSGLPDESRLREPAVILGLSAPRDRLVSRLDERVAGMWRDGLLKEVRGLLAQGLERGVTARRAIGYAQAVAQLAGDLPETEAIGQAAALTRRYARRQVGWFRRYPHAEWLEHDDPDLVDRALALTLAHG
ncbi:tRNA (adenosine(37)-N6)-dimethylallyltransferase MiaA [Leifsonia bigeumensis]|uniref:tRNA dimethylallyltransferase n=1 Tax=Leifsonella bigeumensis TaxID=433643 RepID=A0ABP7FN73_9MICO